MSLEVIHPEVSKKQCSPADTLILARAEKPIQPTGISDLQRWDNKSVSLSVTKFGVICYGSNRKRTLFMRVWYLLVFSPFPPGIIAMQMVHSVIYHFPLILLKQSFTILVPLCIAGLSVPCIVFQGSLGKTLLFREPGIWLGRDSAHADCFWGYWSILTIRATTPCITKLWPQCPRAVPRCQLMYRQYTYSSNQYPFHRLPWIKF